MNPWDHIISEEEQRAYRAAGFGNPSGIGKRPALLIIDVQYRTVGTQPKPFWESIKEFPTSHAVNLFDMASKYADVAPAAEIIQKLDSIARRDHELQTS